MPSKNALTDEEILKYVNVPTEIAAPYIEWSNQALRAALREGSVPFGSAAQPSERNWSYNIMAPALVKYKHGELPAYSPTKLQSMMVESVEEILAAKMQSLDRVMRAVLDA